MNVNVQAQEINGQMYYSVHDFATIVHKSEKVIYRLINKGNALRKLKADFILGHPMIPVSELTEYVYTGPGRYPLKDQYRIDENGVTVPVTLAKETADAL